MVVIARDVKSGVCPRRCHVQQQDLRVWWPICAEQGPVFETTLCQWRTLSDMSQVCSIGAAITMNNCIYVVGGYDRTSLKYDPATDSWTRLSRPSHNHCNAPAVVWRGSMLVAVGGGPKPESSVVEQYNPLTDTLSDWTTTLDVKMTGHCMLNVDLYGIV